MNEIMPRSGNPSLPLHRVSTMRRAPTVLKYCAGMSCKAHWTMP